MKAVAIAAIIMFAVLVHVGAIALVMSHPGFLALAAVVTLLILAHFIAKPSKPHWNFPIGRKALSAASTVLLITGTTLVLVGFVIAHLCNSNIDILVCAYPRSGDFICHKIGPVLLLLGLVGSLAVRHLPPVSSGESCD